MASKDSRIAACKRRVLGQASRPTFWRDVGVEAVATFLLVAVQCSVLLSWGRGGAAAVGSVPAVGLSVAAVVIILTWALADFGGCYMNPAVAISMVLARKICPMKATLYVIAQCIGAVGAAAFVYVITPVGQRGSGGATLLNPELAWWQGVLTETFVTFILVLTIFAANDKRLAAGLSPAIPIGLAYGLGAMSAFASTGGSLNPARSLGPAVVTGQLSNLWIYWAGPILGAALAAGAYMSIARISDPAKSLIEQDAADGGEDGPATEADRETIDLQTKMESGENGVELVTAEAT